MPKASPQAWTMTILRVTVGFIFYAHGINKLFALNNVRGLFTALELPDPTFSALAITVVELLGGLLLITGIGTRYVSAVFVFSSLIAMSSAHIGNGLFNGNGGVEYTLLLAVVNAVLCADGATFASAEPYLAKPVSWLIKTVNDLANRLVPLQQINK